MKVKDLIKAILFEDAESGKNVIKAWVNTKSNEMIIVPEKYHHSNYVVIFHDRFDFEKVMKVDPEKYMDMFSRAGLLLPKFSDEIVSNFVSAGWVRIGYDYDYGESGFYADGKDLKHIWKALRIFYRYVENRIDDVNPMISMDMLDNNHIWHSKNILKGDQFNWFLKYGSIKRIIPDKELVESYYVGNCVKSFNSHGDCVADLPYSDVTEFAQAEENYKPIDKDLFLSKVGDLSNVKISKKNHLEYLYDEDNDLYILYDTIKDIHYFFKA